jgi:hypothetical protein
LEIVVDRYGKDIAPYAVALAQKLAEAFHAYAGEDDDEEASMAAVQCVEAMAAVLASLDDNENNVYAQLEPYLRPVLHRVFDESGEFLEYFENGIEVVSYLTYHGSTPFSDELWSLFDQMIRAFHGFACDYIAELVPSLDNFVSRDTEKFLASSRLESLVGVPERFLWPDHQTRGGEEDCRKATHVLLSVLHNCRGRVDEYVRQRCTPLVAAALERALGPPRADEIGTKPDGVVGMSPDAVWRPRLGAALLDVWNSLLIYNPQLALHALDEGKVTPAQTQLLLTKWLELAPDAKGMLSRKLYALGLSAVLSVEPCPPKVQQARPQMLSALVDVLANMRKNKEDKIYGDKDDDDDAVASAEDEWVEDDDDEDEDDDDDDDREAIQNGMGAQQLAGIRARLAEFDAAEAWLHDDDDDDDGDNYLYESPLDEEDPNQHFVRALHACKRAGDFEALCAQLGAERLATLQEVAVEVEQQASQALV